MPVAPPKIGYLNDPVIAGFVTAYVPRTLSRIELRCYRIEAATMAAVFSEKYPACLAVAAAVRGDDLVRKNRIRRSLELSSQSRAILTSSPVPTIIRSVVAIASSFDFFKFYQMIPPVNTMAITSNSPIIPT